MTIEQFFYNGIVEGGHYYLAKGPTEHTKAGWDISVNLANALFKEPNMMLFIDDVHDLHEMKGDEAIMPRIEWSPEPSPDIIFNESATVFNSQRIIEAVTKDGTPLSKKSRAKFGNTGKIFMSEFPLTNEVGEFMCVTMDAGLTLSKAEMGFPIAVNVLPAHYEEEQQQLHELVARSIIAMEDENQSLHNFQLITILFDEDGTYWIMQPNANRKFSSAKWNEFLTNNNLLTY